MAAGEQERTTRSPGEHQTPVVPRPPRRLGFVGLGHMGAPMAVKLLEQGNELTVFDRDPARASSLAERGAWLAATLADLASAETVFVSLPGPHEVEQVVLAPAGLLETMVPGSCLVSVSTVSPRLIRRVAEVGQTREVAVVDAPVTGAADGAAAGTLTIMVGAEPAELARCRPLLEALSSRIVHVGAVGTGSAAKLVTNMLWFTHVVALSDALALGIKAGIPADALAALIPASAGGSWVADHDLPNILRDDDDTTFTLALCRKDLGLIIELLQESGVSAPLARLADERFHAAHERYGPQAGELAVTRLAEEAASVSFRVKRRSAEGGSDDG